MAIMARCSGAMLHALPVLLMFLLALTPGISLTEDLGRHLLLGKIIAQTGQVPTTNFLTYTYPDFPFVNHHWLSQVVFYFLHGMLGLDGLIVFKALLLSTALALAMHAAPPGRAQPLYALAGMLSAVILGFRAHIRPELFTYLGVALYIWTIARADCRMDAPAAPGAANLKAALWRWTPVIAYGWFWANAHIYFIFGIGMVGAFWMARWLCNWRDGVPLRHAWPRAESIVLPALIAVSIINPNGWRGLVYPLNIFSNYGVAITENASPFRLWETVLNPMLLALPILAILAAVIFYKAWRNRRALCAGQLAGLLIFAAALVATTCMARSAPLAALTLPAALGFALRNFRFHKPSLIEVSRRVLGVAAACGVCVWLAYSVIGGAYSRIFPSPIAPTPFGLDNESRYLALRRLYQDGLPLPVFSDYNIGSLVEYNIYPAPAYVDNRPEAFPMEFWRDEYQPALALGAEWEDMINRRGIQTVAVSIAGVKEGFIRALYNDPRWQLVHIDFFCAVFARATPANRPFLSRHAWSLSAIAQFAGQSMDNIKKLSAAGVWRRQILADQIVYEAYALICLGEYAPAWQLIWEMHLRYPDYQVVHELMRVCAPPGAAAPVMQVMAQRARRPLAAKQALDWGAVLEAQGRPAEARHVYRRARWFFPLSQTITGKIKTTYAAN